MFYYKLKHFNGSCSMIMLSNLSMLKHFLFKGCFAVFNFFNRVLLSIKFTSKDDFLISPFFSRVCVWTPILKCTFSKAP